MGSGTVDKTEPAIFGIKTREFTSSKRPHSDCRLLRLLHIGFDSSPASLGNLAVRLNMALALVISTSGDMEAYRLISARIKLGIARLLAGGFAAPHTFVASRAWADAIIGADGLVHFEYLGPIQNEQSADCAALDVARVYAPESGSSTKYLRLPSSPLSNGNCYVLPGWYRPPTTSE